MTDWSVVAKRLYTALDGEWADAVEVDPRVAMAQARLALANGTGLDEARRSIDEQIRHTGIAFRGLTLGWVIPRQPAGPVSAEAIGRLLSDLHVTAFRLSLRLADHESAQDHLISAIACSPDDPAPRRMLANLRWDTGDHQAAVPALDAAITDDLTAAFELLDAGVELGYDGSASSAEAFQRAGERDPVGLIADVCRYRLDRLDRPDSWPRTTDEVNDIYFKAGEQLVAGNVPAAVSGLVAALGWVPKWPVAWFGLGFAYRSRQPSHGEYKPASNAPITEIRSVGPIPLDDATYDDVRRAAQAFRIAAALDPDFAEAHNDLAGCELSLDRPALALAPAMRFRELRPHEAASHANLGVVLARIGEHEAARAEATAALDIDPTDPVAREVLRQ